MAKDSPNDVGLKVGLEIHQQLATDSKLFCSCRPVESAKYTTEFRRKLRASKGELGRYDPAALFERAKSNSIVYYGNPQSSCLVEQDEEPPHGLDENAKRISLIMALALKSKVFSEIYPMRKTVVDGSNTAGFQRTMLVSHGGFYEADGHVIKIQSICLEEDAARIVGDEKNVRKYSLDRLGIPLVEIATEPFEASPKEIKKIALALGRILRSTRNVKRGIGSIRQDVNVSIKGGGTVVEVKGVQQLDQLEKVVQYEVKRQTALLHISESLRDRGLEKPRRMNITDMAKSWNSKIIGGAIRKNHDIVLMVFGNLAGMFGREYSADIRLGRDMAELVRFFGLGGIFHSDELPEYGIVQDNVDEMKKKHGINNNDAFLLVAAPRAMTDVISEHIFLRLTDIRDNGIPRDTRLATQSGQTKFLRPRPGAARMYPETDVPPITISHKELDEARKNIPKPWNQYIAELQEKFNINAQLAEQIFDSRYMELFEYIAKRVSNPAFVASMLCSSVTSMQRDGLDSGLLKDAEIIKTFESLERGDIAKESVGIIFEDIMAGRSATVEEAIKNTSIEPVSESELDRIIKDVIAKNMDLVNSQKERAAGPLMGIVMKDLRGKASGKTISRILLQNIKKVS